MSHVFASRALLPGWIERGEGHLITTASMAGILTSLGDAAYASTKHAAVGFAEWLAITYASEGVKVSCICPGAVDTAMLRAGGEGDAAKASAIIGGGEVLGPEAAAERILEGVGGGPLPDPHPPRDARVRGRQGAGARALGARHEPPLGTRPGAARLSRRAAAAAAGSDSARRPRRRIGRRFRAVYVRDGGRTGTSATGSPAKLHVAALIADAARVHARARVR